MLKSRKSAPMSAVTVAVAAGVVVSLSGCSSTPAAPNAPVTSTTPTAKAPIEFWGWNPAYPAAVELWNKTHDQKVVYQTVASGGKGGYTKMQAAAKAGNAACLGQVGNESIPGFAVDGTLMDVTKEAAQYEKDYNASGWAGMKVGDHVYGIPLDISPMGLFYRSDIYKKFGITPAKTWDEFATQSAKVHAADPNVYLTSFSPINYTIGSLVQQAGGTYIKAEADSWKVEVNSDATKKVLTFWQQMLDAKTVKAMDPESPEWFAEVQAGHIAGYVAPVWWAGALAGAAAGTSGKWSVAPLPNIDAGKASNGSAGGSATAVLKGCKDVEGALAFANWLATDLDSVNVLIEKASIFPASTPGLKATALDAPVAFFGGQKIFEVFKKTAGEVDTTWAYGPIGGETDAAFTDAMKPVREGKAKMVDQLPTIHKALIDALKAKGLSVTE